MIEHFKFIKHNNYNLNTIIDDEFVHKKKILFHNPNNNKYSFYMIKCNTIVIKSWRHIN